MFIGHFGLSFAAKRAAPKVSLGTLFIATQFVDILWPLLLVLHIEKVAIIPGYTKTNSFDFLYYPYTHSLFMGVVWGVVIGAIYRLFRRDTRGAIVIGLCVLSHWFLDLVVHVADLPLSPFGEYKTGLGLWNYVALTLIIEMMLFLGGAAIYNGFTKAKNKIGSRGLGILVILLIALQFSNTFGPPPSGTVMNLFVIFMIMMALIVGFAYLVDGNRELR